MDKLPFGPGHGAPVEVFRGLTSPRLGTTGVVWAMLKESKLVPRLDFSFLGSHALRRLPHCGQRKESQRLEGANYMLNTFAQS